MEEEPEAQTGEATCRRTHSSSRWPSGSRASLRSPHNLHTLGSWGRDSRVEGLCSPLCRGQAWGPRGVEPLASQLQANALAVATALLEELLNKPASRSCLLTF